MIRRAIGTTLAGLCALTGPLAGSSFAATGPTLNLSATTARPGVPFTVTPASGCPADQEIQSVDLTFTDAGNISHAIGTIDTADDGSWGPATVTLPVAGLDDDGAWSNTPVKAGPGTVAATCSSSDSTDPGDDDSDDGQEGDEADDTTVVTQTYAAAALTAAGTAPQLGLSASVLTPGDSVTVSPAEGCAATGVSTVEVDVISLAATTDDGDDGDDGDDSDDNSGDDDGDGDGDDSTDPSDDPVDLVSTWVTTSSTGTWTPTTLVLPADTATGDYAVIASCSTGDTVTSSYDAAPLALGTVTVSAAVCGARSVYANLTGTYSGLIAGKDDITLPSRLALTGDGPWKLKVRSATTGQVLATRTVACAKPQYELDVSKTGLSSSNKPRAWVCNTGRGSVTGVLQVMADKKYKKVDKETLTGGDCTWLTGSKLDKGEQVKARVLIDAPGKAADDVVESFTVKRPKN
jgi:hypothetical protein